MVGKDTLLQLVGRASHLSFGGRVPGIGGKATPLPFGGQGIPLTYLFFRNMIRIA